jgi:23S rRNA (cytosine1962-C5)-methyltransferase
VDRARVWPDFEESWILHRDADVVVVDKPTGVPTQAADPEMPDDVVTRVRSALGLSYLGVHQRLDQGTSGVLLFTARREANARIAVAFEKRQAKKRYLACVEGWPRKRARATLEDALAPGEGGRMRVVRSADRGAQRAVTDVKLVQWNGGRALLELELRTGRTHQARVQLAHAGAPVAGDLLYGGAPAERLMLHASSLEIAGARYAASTPRELERWLAHGPLGDRVYDDPEALARALERAVRARYALGRSSGARATTAFRVVNEAGDGLPALAVDAYDAWLVAQFYEGSTWNDARKERVLDALAALGFDGVYVKMRPKQSNTLVDTRRDELAPKDPSRGVAAPDPLRIEEEGVPYLVRLGDGLSTGIFLDQRGNRRRLRELSLGKSVANLFAYTCAFTVAAALGGAKRTVSVDAAAAALERGRANLEAAGARDDARHAFVAADAFQWLARARTKGERFDLVILDPPSYSKTKRRRFVAESDYAELAAEALGVVAPGGALLACLNHRGVTKARFRKVLHDALRRARREALQVKDMPEPREFPVAKDAELHLKAVFVRTAPDGL